MTDRLCADGLHEADGGCCWERDRELVVLLGAGESPRPEGCGCTDKEPCPFHRHRGRGVGAMG